MDGVIANRDEPIPVINIPSLAPSDPPPAKKSECHEADHDASAGVRDEASVASKQSLQERLLNHVLSQLLPPIDARDGQEGSVGDRKDARAKPTIERPTFSIPMMSSNFRRFNARVGVVFVLQNRLIQLFAWKRPTATLSFLAIYTLLCLQPHLLPILPIAGLLFWIMVPSFMARYPAPPNDTRLEPSFTGPPIAPPRKVKPAPELSKDFFRNMRDLQNSMEDFSRLHDAANEYIVPYTDFSDEHVSSMLFVVLFAVTCLGFLTSTRVPWNLLALIGGWVVTLMGHPDVQAYLKSSGGISSLQQHADILLTNVKNLIEVDILLDSPAEVRQVEIFELQKFHIQSDTWEPWLFSPKPYEPLSPARIAGARAKGTQFFEDVQAPQGWIWKDKKWNLDLFGREWVEQRLITGVEVETEGERWVYDLPAEEVDLLQSPTKGKAKGGNIRQVPKSGWEEGSGQYRHGQWRRRRWIRLVERAASRQTDKNG